MISLVSKDYRELQFCRICSGKFASETLKLADTPLANELYRSRDEAINAKTFPLEVVMCNLCKHVQLKYIVSPTRLFDNYVYQSSTSSFFRKHFVSLAKFIVEELPEKNGLIIEVGSNDGYLLKELQNRNLSAIGIEPSEKLVKYSRALGLNVKRGYLDSLMVESLLSEVGAADIVVGNNVFAHIDDLVTAFLLVNRLLKEDGMFIFEVADFAKLVQTGIFDTIYHEHMSYHTLLGLFKLSELSDFKVVDIFEIGSHGGSLRFVLRKSRSSFSIHKRVKLREKFESENNFINSKVFGKLHEDIRQRKERLTELLAQREDTYLIGYGAPAKLVTFVFQMGIRDFPIEYVIDDNKMKQNFFIPGLGYEIISSARMKQTMKTKGVSEGLSIILFPWNLNEEIVIKLKRWVPPNTIILRAFPKVYKEQIS